MPKLSQIDPNRQLQVSQKDVYRYGTPEINPTVKPIDAYVQTGSDIKFRDVPGYNIRTPNMQFDTTEQIDAATRDARSIAQIFNNLEGSFKSYSHYRREVKDDERKEGYYQAVRGVELSANANENQTFGYNLYKGEADAMGALHNTLNDAFSKYALTDTQEEWNKRVEEIRKPYLENKPDAYLEGFLPKSVGIINGYATKFYGLQVSKRQEETLNNIITVFGKEFDDIVSDKSLPATGKAQLVRDVLTKHQDSAKELGIDRNSITQKAIEYIGEKAASDGTPGLLSFVKLPDKDGVSLVNTQFFKEISKYEREAKNKAQANETHAIALADRAERKQKEAVQAQLASKLLAGQDISKDLADAGIVKSLGANAITFDNINRQRQDPDYNIKSDPVGFMSKSIKARNGEYSYDELMDDVNSRRMNKEDGMRLAGEIEQFKKYSEGQNKPYQTEFEPYHIGRAQIKTALTPEIELPIMRNKTLALQANAEIEFATGTRNEFNANLQRNNGKFNPEDEIYRTNIDKLTQSIISKYKPQVSTFNKEALDSTSRLDSEKPSETKKRFDNKTSEEITKEFAYPTFEQALTRFQTLDKAGAFKSDKQKQEVFMMINNMYNGRGK